MESVNCGTGHTPGYDVPMKLIFNYEGIFYSFFYDNAETCVLCSRDYAINYVYSGEMVLDTSDGNLHVRKGECVFIPRDHRISMYKKPYGGERYCGIFMRFTRTFLRELYARHRCGLIQPGVPRSETGVVKLPVTAEIESLFSSLTPFFNPDVSPQDDFMQLKMHEGLLALLHVDTCFATMLFDFSDPWKIDILDFMEKNYMYEFSMAELAHYTGRSLSTFKRDFKKVSSLTPEKWLVGRRLDAAYDMIKKGGVKITEVCSNVGFKNQSHFSVAFKKRFGRSPSEVQLL